MLAGTSRPRGQPVKVSDVPQGIGKLRANGSVRVAVNEPGHRSTSVDLVDAFATCPAGLHGLKLVSSPVSAWTPSRSFDLITCVHGLHYVGDKLAALARAAGWLTRDGLLVADLDLAGISIAGQPATRRLARALRDAGFSYDSRRHRISRKGKLEAALPYRYLGADDRSGPNYTGQPAVTSHYE